jgi:hypothetical protein
MLSLAAINNGNKQELLDWGRRTQSKLLDAGAIRTTAAPAAAAASGGAKVKSSGRSKQAAGKATTSSSSSPMSSSSSSSGSSLPSWDELWWSVEPKVDGLAASVTYR